MKFLRTIERPPLPDAAPRAFPTTTGAIEGVVLGEGFNDLQVRTADLITWKSGRSDSD